MHVQLKIMLHFFISFSSVKLGQVNIADLFLSSLFVRHRPYSAGSKGLGYELDKEPFHMAKKNLGINFKFEKNETDSTINSN